MLVVSENGLIRPPSILDARKKTDLLNRFDSCTKTAQNKEKFPAARLLIEQIFDDRTLPYKFNRVAVSMSFWTLVNLLNTNQQLEWQGLINDLLKVLFEIGFREDIKSHQEYLLQHDHTGSPFASTPYTPTGLAQGKQAQVFLQHRKYELTPEEVDWARKLEMKVAGHHEFFGLPEENNMPFLIPISLERISANNETIRDPRPLDKDKFANALREGLTLEKAFEASTIPHKKTNFPYPRN